MLSIEGRLKECIAENESLKAKLRAYEEDTMVAIPDGELLKEKKGKTRFWYPYGSVLKSSYRISFLIFTSPLTRSRREVQDIGTKT